MKEIFISSVDIEQLSLFAEQENLPRFRVEQILDWVYGKWCVKPDDMQNLPLKLRERLKQAFVCASSSVKQEFASPDGTLKLLIELQDGETIESVIIPSSERNTFCLSTQVGCPVQCHFCASGSKGLVRNMTSGEIMEQLFHACCKLDALPENIVFMGIGEGLLNFDALTESLKRICSNKYMGVASRRITVSTSGWVDGIRRLAELEQQWNLAISLHSVDDAIRAQLIPDRFRCSVSDILKASNYYRQKTGRMVTFEYTLLAGINDSSKDAKQLAKVAKQERAKVNLIPYNTIGDSKFKKPHTHTIKNFEHILIKAGVSVTIRLERGDQLNAACGQLSVQTRQAT